MRDEENIFKIWWKRLGQVDVDDTPQDQKIDDTKQGSKELREALKASLKKIEKEYEKETKGLTSRSMTNLKANKKDIPTVTSAKSKGKVQEPKENVR